jgi:hypothetical protein
MAQSRFQPTSSGLCWLFFVRVFSTAFDFGINPATAQIQLLRDEGYDEACLNKNEAYIFQDNPMLI